MAPMTRLIVDHINASDLVPGGPPGAWNDFVADGGWTHTLRYRLMTPSLQIEGTAAGALPGNARFRIGIIPVGFRPARVQRWAGSSAMALAYGWAVFDLGVDGQLYGLSALGEGGQQVTLGMSALVPLD